MYSGSLLVCPWDLLALQGEITRWRPMIYRPVSYTPRQLCLEGWSSRCKKRPTRPSPDCARQPVKWEAKRPVQVTSSLEIISTFASAFLTFREPSMNGAGGRWAKQVLCGYYLRTFYLDRQSWGIWGEGEFRVCHVSIKELRYQYSLRVQTCL